MTWPPDTGSIKPYFEDASCVIFHADCRDVLPHLEGVTHVLMDPPYSDHVHENTRTNAGTDGVSGGAELELGFDSLSPTLRLFVAKEVQRLVERWTLVFSDVESTHLWKGDLCEWSDTLAADPARLEYVRTGIWLKIGAMPQVTGDRPGSGYESIVIAHATKANGDRMKKRWNGGGKAGVWRERVPQKRDGRVHPSEKPWPLLSQLLIDFTDDDDIILDPFAGSGSLARAAADVGERRVILIEGKEKWCAQAASRRGAPVPETNGQRGLQW